MKERTQITFNGPAAWREELNRRADDWGVPVTQIILLAVHLLLRRSDAEDIAMKFANLNAKRDRFVDRFKPGEPDPFFSGAPVADAALSALASAMPSPTASPSQSPRVRKTRKPAASSKSA